MAKKKSTYIPRDEVLEINKEIDKVKEKAIKELMKIPGVVQVGVGLKVCKGELKRIPCFKVTVKKKKDKKDLPKKELIPPKIYGFETDVDELEEDEIVADRNEYRPLIGGCQIGISEGSGLGTLGCFAKRNSDDKIVLLSNWHVLVSTLSVGDERVGQPSHNGCCSCCACNEIGKVVDGSLQGNNMDAAIALLNGQDDDTIPEHKYLNEIIGIGHIAGSAAPVAMETVFKKGRTTGWTEGQIINTTYSSNTPYDSYGGGITISRTAHRIHPHSRHPKFSEKGDSGSVIVNEHNQAVLLLYAKTSNNDGVATPIPAIESQLNISILDSTFHKNETDANGDPARGVLLNSVAPGPVRTENLKAAFVELQKEITQFEKGRSLIDTIEKHVDEALHLVNNNRETMAAWNRYQGPEFLAHIVRSIRRENKPIPERIKGVSLQNLLLKMTAVLKRNGSPELVKDLDAHYLEVLEIFQAGNSPEDWIDKLASEEEKLTT